MTEELNIKNALNKLDEYSEFYEEYTRTPSSRLTEDLKEVKKQVDAHFEQIKMAIALKDPWFFVVNYVYTQDENDTVNPFKKFIGPQETYEDYGYFEEITRLWQEERLIIIPKSRQRRITWLFAALFLWDAITYKGRLNGMQTKNEEAANKLIDRVDTIARNLPREMLAYDPKMKTYCKFHLPDTMSNIWGLPQNPDAARSHTFSNYLIDEAWTQEDLEGTYTSARPTGTKLVMVCSPPTKLNRSAIFFGNVAEDRYGVENVDENTPHGKIDKYKIIDVRQNRNGFVSAKVHYSMAAHTWCIFKENGKEVRKWVTMEEWKKEAKKGMSQLSWDREHEISFATGLGDQIFEPELIEAAKKNLSEPIAKGRLRYNVATKRVEFVEGNGALSIWQHPVDSQRITFGRPKCREQYVGSGDVGAGLSMSGDPSVCYIANARTKRIVARWRGHRRPKVFAYELWLLGHYYNEAFLVIEANSYGLSVLEALWDGDKKLDETGKLLHEQTPYDNLYCRKVMDESRDRTTKKLGFYMTNASGDWKKTMLIDAFGQAVRNGTLKLSDRELVEEMQNFIEFEDGKLGAARGKDDCVIAAALLWHGLEERPYSEEEVYESESDREWSPFDTQLVAAGEYEGY